MKIEIPIVDLSEFSTQKTDFANQLGKHYQQFGFVGFTNHGISDDTINAARRAFELFFQLDESTKQAYAITGTGGARGYTGFGVEQAKDHDVPDLKEFWHIGKELGSDNPYPDKLFPNLWPAEVASIRSDGYALFMALDRLGRQILSALALYLQLPEDWFETKVNYGTSILRAIHYPPIQSAQAGQVRAARHEDINLITLLVGSEQSGLEILSRDDQWIPVATIEGTIVVNIGDMLQRMTNHVLPSTTHRVVNPEGDAAMQARYSMPYFQHLNPDFLIETLPQCITTENPNRYQTPITADEYLQQRLREIKLA